MIVMQKTLIRSFILFFMYVWGPSVLAESEPTCYGNPKILGCFDAYKADLRNTHYKQLDVIARRIATSQQWKLPIDYITIIGHAATFGSNSSVDVNAEKRARNVASVLATKLDKLGVKNYKIVEANLSDSRPRVSNSTQQGRALNRRVEVVFTSQREILGYIEVKTELCALKGLKNELVKIQSHTQCGSLAQAKSICEDNLDLAQDMHLTASACHPFSVSCVVCQGGS